MVYGSRGVCQVENIGPIQTKGAKEDQLYYTLSICNVSGSTIFTPAENPKVKMRLTITKAEAEELIEKMIEIEPLGIEDEKQREAIYKEAFFSVDCIQLVKIIKTIYLRKEQRIQEGKKTTSIDDKYFHMAEDALYGELAISLGLEREAARKYVVDSIKKYETQS